MIRFSIIIPVKAINDYVRETVPLIQALGSCDWELIILPNEFGEDEWGDSNIRIIPSGMVGPAAKRDIGASYAVGEILVFLDDDSYPNADFLKVATPYFMDDEIVAIGGPAITPPNDGFWQRVSGAVFLSKYSGGNPERYISIGESKEIDDWPSVNFIVRKKEFLEIGGFDSPYWPGEDTKLCHDLVTKTDKKILYIPNLIVWHHRREGLVTHLKQVGAYGLHRGYFAKKFPKTSRKFKYFIPSFFCIFIAFNLFYPIYPPIVKDLIVLVWIGYLFVILRAFIEIKRHEALTVSLATLPYIFLTQVWYGIRFLQGIFSSALVSKLR